MRGNDVDEHDHKDKYCLKRKCHKRAVAIAESLLKSGLFRNSRQTNVCTNSQTSRSCVGGGSTVELRRQSLEGLAVKRMPCAQGPEGRSSRGQK
jgi:hypothetical protein